MKLTPIRVRGKRGQAKAEEKSKRHRLTSTGGDDGDNGGKDEHDKMDAAAETSVTASSRPRRSKPPPRLSQLPQEILERIFIASTNLALPLANRELYHRLTSTSVRYQLIAAAFGPTWDAWYGVDAAEVQSYDGWMVDAHRIAGNPAFQSAILACAWAKCRVLLEAFNVWIRQHANGRPYFAFPRNPRDAHDPDDLAPEDNVLFGSMQSKFDYDIGYFITGVTQHLEDGPWDDRAIECRALLGTHLEVHPGTLIPDDLLGGPYMSEDADGGGRLSYEIGLEKYERLFWLVRGGACLQQGQTWEVSREGFDAILDLVKEAVRRQEARIKEIRSRGEEIDPEADYSDPEMLKLAAGFFMFFDILGVFGAQWPKYILQTSLADIIQLIPTVRQNSRPEMLLGNFAAGLRYAMRNNGTAPFYDMLGARWRRPALRVLAGPARGDDAGFPSSLRPRGLPVRVLAHYRMGWHRALYLDTALGLNANHATWQAHQPGPEHDRYPASKQVYRHRFDAYLLSVGFDPRQMQPRSLRSGLFHEDDDDDDVHAEPPPLHGAAIWGSQYTHASQGGGGYVIHGHEPWSDFGLD